MYVAAIWKNHFLDTRLHGNAMPKVLWMVGV